jgi:hypothetical protein
MITLVDDRLDNLRSQIHQITQDDRRQQAFAIAKQQVIGVTNDHNCGPRIGSFQVLDAASHPHTEIAFPR